MRAMWPLPSSTLFLSFSLLLTQDFQLHWTMFRCLSTTACLASGPLHLLLPLLRKVLSPPSTLLDPFHYLALSCSIASSKRAFPITRSKLSAPSYFLLLFHFILLIAILHIYLFVGTFSLFIVYFLLYHEKFHGQVPWLLFLLYIPIT